MLLAGDFRQTAPIVKRGGPGQVRAASILSSELWPQCVELELTRNMRAAGEGADADAYRNWLLGVGDGRAGSQVKIPASMVYRPLCDPSDSNAVVQEMARAVFGHHTEQPAQQCTAYAKNKRILTATNAAAQMVNSAIYSRLPAANEEGHEQAGIDNDGQPTWSDDRREVVSLSMDSCPEGGELVAEELLNELAPGGLPPHELRIRVGHPLMLLRNMDITNGHTNGTVYTVMAVRDNAIALLPENARAGAQWWWCPKIELSTENTDDFHFCRRQFPFKHAWAATINKSQGATLDHYAIYCDRHLFGHGQAYTALSRGRSQETCKVYVCCEDSPPDSLTNVVQEDLLGGTGAGHVHHSDAIDGESSGEEEPGAAGPFGALITERDVMARYSQMHYKHPDGTDGRVTKARRAGTGWEAMIVWYNADGSAEPMSDGDDETTSEGVQRWHKEGPLWDMFTQDTGM